MLKMHLGGLNRMIELRGGLNAIRETNPMVANSVFWFVTPQYRSYGIITGVLQDICRSHV